MKKQVMFLFLLVSLSFSFVSAQDCSNFVPSEFNEQVIDIHKVNCAVKANLSISSGQFQLTSLKQEYVLSNRVDLDDEFQNKDLLMWLTFYSNVDRIKDKEYSYALYFDWAFFNNNLTNETLDLLDSVLNKSVDLLNNKISYFVRDREIYKDTTLFLHLANINEIAFGNVEGYFSGHDYKYNNLEENHFYTAGERSTIFSFRDLKIYSALGFSDFFIDSDGRVSASKYNGEQLSSQIKTYVSSEGLVFETDGQAKFSLPNDVVLVSGSATWKNGVLTIKENSAFDWNPLSNHEGTHFSIKGDKRIVVINSDCPTSDLSCLSYKSEQGKNVVSFYLKNDINLLFSEDYSFNKDVTYFVDFIEDSNSLNLVQSNSASFKLSKDNVLVKGTPVNEILFNRLENGSPCYLHIGVTTTSGCGSITEDPTAFSMNLRRNIIHMIENHQQRIKEDGVGTFYGSVSNSACFTYKGILNEQEMWVANALNNLNKKNICLHLNSCVNKVKSLRNELTDAQKVYYYFAVKEGKTDLEAREFAKNYDENSRLLGDFDVRDYSLGMTYCSDFVHRALSRTYDDIGLSEGYDKIGIDKTESIHYIVMHYVLYKGWDLVLLDPHNNIERRLYGNFFRKDGKLYVRTLIKKNPSAEIKFVLKGYYRNENSDALRNFAEMLGENAGIVSIEYGNHAATIVAIDGVLYLGENHWDMAEKTQKTIELSPLWKNSLTQALVAVPPGVLR